jgi:4-alpha-glucanotransferase
MTPEISSREEDALAEAFEKYADGVLNEELLQYLFFKQWGRVRAHAAELGVQIIGDMPIYVSGGSADVWQRPSLFSKDKVSGCPPDAFSEDGQLWGSPVYDWDEIAREGYGFFIERFAHAFRLFDIVRVDHFRGFEAYWSIPVEAESAKSGCWEKAPGSELFSRLKGWFGELPVIAEDLGMLTPEFFEFKRECGFPGMKVLQFAFAPYENSMYLPHNYEKNAGVSTGTHDNDTTLSWFTKLPRAEREYLCAYVGRCTPKNVCEKLIRTAMASVCDVCIIPMQDVLEQDGSYRMNEPGKMDGNWTYRLREGDFSEKEQKKMFELSRIYSR